jgi:hypothetical protein
VSQRIILSQQNCINLSQRYSPGPFESVFQVSDARDLMPQWEYKWEYIQKKLIPFPAGFQQVFCLAAEGQYLLDQCCGPLCSLQYLVHVVFGFFRGGKMHLGQLGIPEDAGKDIVEIMGNAACQGADGFQISTR